MSGEKSSPSPDDQRRGESNADVFARLELNDEATEFAAVQPGMTVEEAAALEVKRTPTVEDPTPQHLSSAAQTETPKVTPRQPDQHETIHVTPDQVAELRRSYEAAQKRKAEASEPTPDQPE
jgi:hypothetical protein